jgi:hypothetical protein
VHHLVTTLSLVAGENRGSGPIEHRNAVEGQALVNEVSDNLAVFVEEGHAVVVVEWRVLSRPVRSCTAPVSSDDGVNALKQKVSAYFRNRRSSQNYLDLTSGDPN